MDKTQLVKQLRMTAEELKPLTNAAEYVNTSKERKPDPYALAWWTMLSAISELLDAQESPLSPKQIACLKNLLFGGIGSLTDLWFDPALLGDQAESINARLDGQTSALYDSFRRE